MAKRRTYHVCHIPGETGSGGLFYEPLDDSFPGLAPLPSICLQIAILALVPHFIHMVLSRFHQPLLVSQILAGILASPSILGILKIRNKGITYFMFPVDGFRVVDMLAHFSSMFFIFKVGVQMDPKILRKAGWRTYVIGLCCLLSSYISGNMVSQRLKSDDNPELKARTENEGFRSAKRIVDLFGQISFPVIAYVLNDLNILNSELGNLALQIAMVADFLHTNEKFITLLKNIISSGYSSHGITVVLLLLGTLIYLFFIVRPGALWIAKNTPEGRPVNDIYIALIMISVLLCGLVSEYCGLNGTVGAFFLGLAIPDGPPLGSALVHKLRVVTTFFMPLHMGIVGYKTNIYNVDFAYVWRVVLVILCCIVGKVVGLLIPAVLLGVSLRDSLLLGLIMNFKGIVEVSQINAWLDSKMQQEIFSASNTIMVLTLIVVVAVITPAVKYLYDPSSKYLSFKGRSVLQSNENNSDFRVLVCVHTINDVPAIIRIIEATDPGKLRPLTIYLLNLVELVGRATPLLIAHPLHKRAASSSNPTKSERIINVFQQFQNRYQNGVTVHPFTTISPYASMHNDICTMSVDKRTALVIFPFCRQDATSSSRCIKTLLQNLLRNSPCSVGILINGSNYQGQTTCFVPDTPYRVIVLYFGGPDDRESLAFAMNMIHNPSVFVTVVRFFDPADEAIGYYNDSVSIDVERQKFLDEELIDHFRINTMDDETLVYKEVEVKDCAETIWVVRSLREDFDLLVVGRQQITHPRIIEGLETDLEESQELGAIGDMVSSPDYGAEGSILIINQRQETT